MEFKVFGSGKEFLDLTQSYLYLRVKVSKADSSNLDNRRKFGFANYPIASLFNQVDVILGGKLISSATNTFMPIVVSWKCCSTMTKRWQSHSEVVDFSAKIQLDKWNKWTSHYCRPCFEYGLGNKE